jgi:hypothetical protein
MTNDEWRMTNEFRIPKSESPQVATQRFSGFELRASFGLRHSAFGLFLTFGFFLWNES